MAAPLPALTGLLLKLAEGCPEFLVVTGRDVKLPAPPECSLSDVWIMAREAVFTVLDMRTAMFQYFVPLVFRLVERAEVDECEVEKLRQSLSRMYEGHHGSGLKSGSS
jgi:hypothetical protein